ncbi:MAG: hypothetical protein ACRD0Z_05570 [Acidimicrobiales bacterium]
MALALALALALAAPVLLAACTEYSGTQSQKVQEWAKQASFVTNNNQIVSDVVLVRKSASIGTGLQFLTDCGGMASDVGTAYEQLPAPDQQLTNYLNDAYTLIGQAAQDCSATKNVHSAVATKSLAQIAKGMGDLQHSQHLLASLGIKWANKQLP